MRPLSQKYKTKAARQGKSAKVNGADAEAKVEEMAAEYLRHGRAEICKRYEPHKYVGRGNGFFKAVYLGKSGCDFEVYLPDGRAGMLELKSRSGGRITKDALDPFQQAQLRRRMLWGHISKVLVRLDDEWIIVDYRRWHEGDRKSHNRDQLVALGDIVEIDARGRPDFLSFL